MAYQLVNELYIKHCWGVYEQNSIVNTVHVDDWTGEWAIIASNEYRNSAISIIHYYIFQILVNAKLSVSLKHDETAEIQQ